MVGADPNKKRFIVHLNCKKCGVIFREVFSVPSAYIPEKVKQMMPILVAKRFGGSGFDNHQCKSADLPEIISIDPITG